jgi:hypothetical protein
LAAAQARLAEVTQERNNQTARLKQQMERADAEAADAGDWAKAYARAEATLAAIRTWADNRRACISWTAQKEVRAILDATPVVTEDPRLAAIRAEVSVIDRSHVDGWYVAQRVLALLDAPPSPEKG